MSLSKNEILDFKELLIKADDTQLTFMKITLEMEAKKRYEVSMAKIAGYYGNEWTGYRLPNGAKTKEIQQ